MPYYMLIPGIDGGSTDENHRGWFEIRDYSLDLAQLANRTTFAPVAVNLSLANGLPTLLSDTAAGRHYPGIRIEGEGLGDNAFVFSTLTLADVQVSALHEEEGPGDKLSFTYGQFGLATRGQNADGSPGPVESYGFDLRTNSVIDLPNPSLVPGNTGGGFVPPIGRYFLLVPGVNGGSMDDNHRGWFEISGFNLDLTRSPGPGPGQGQGRTTFSPLAVDLNTATALPDLLANIATGRHLPGVRIEGETTQGNVVYTLTLADAQIGLLHDSAGDAVLTDDNLSFTYSQIGLVTRPQSQTGSLGPAQSFGFDLTTNTVIPPPNPALTTSTATSLFASNSSDVVSSGLPAELSVIASMLDPGVVQARSTAAEWLVHL